MKNDKKCSAGSKFGFLNSLARFAKAAAWFYLTGGEKLEVEEIPARSSAERRSFLRPRRRVTVFRPVTSISLAAEIEMGPKAISSILEVLGYDVPPSEEIDDSQLRQIGDHLRIANHVKEDGRNGILDSVIIGPRLPKTLSGQNELPEVG